MLSEAIKKSKKKYESGITDSKNKFKSGISGPKTEYKSSIPEQDRDEDLGLSPELMKYKDGPKASPKKESKVEIEILLDSAKKKKPENKSTENSYTREEKYFTTPTDKGGRFTMSGEEARKRYLERLRNKKK